MNPEKLRRIRRLAAVKCVDDRGPHTFTGPRKAADAAAYRPVGPARWFAVLDDGAERPLPADEPPAQATALAAQAPVVAQAVVAQAVGQRDPVELALHFGDRSAERIARAYAEAYKEAGKSWSSVVEPLARVLQALAGRVETLERELEARPAPVVMEPADDDGAASELDDMATAVMVGIAKDAMQNAAK